MDVVLESCTNTTINLEDNAITKLVLRGLSLNHTQPFLCFLTLIANPKYVIHAKFIQGRYKKYHTRIARLKDQNCRLQSIKSRCYEYDRIDKMRGYLHDTNTLSYRFESSLDQGGVNITWSVMTLHMPQLIVDFITNTTGKYSGTSLYIASI